MFDRDVSYIERCKRVLGFNDKFPLSAIICSTCSSPAASGNTLSPKGYGLTQEQQVSGIYNEHMDRGISLRFETFNCCCFLHT